MFIVIMQKNVSVYSNTKESDCSKYSVLTAFSDYISFFSCFDSLLLNFRQGFSSNWLLYSCICFGFPNKNWASLYLINLRIVALCFHFMHNLQVFQSCRKLIIGNNLKIAAGTVLGLV
jgi:hypothetical protein